MSGFEYLHSYIEAADSRSDYPDETVQDELSELGQEGWELVNMTPDWVWFYYTIQQRHSFGPTDMPDKYDVDAPYSLPEYIQGWYCTFKRSVS